MNAKQLLVIALLGGLSACGGPSPTSGFKVRAQKEVVAPGGGTVICCGPPSASGAWLADIGSASGSVRSFGPLFCFAPCPIAQGRVPARWRIDPGIAECIGTLSPPAQNIAVGGQAVLRCLIAGILFPVHVTPALVDLRTPPGKLEVSGAQVVTTHGMPRIEIYDAYSGAILATTTATEVGSKASWLQAPMPDLSALRTGMYYVLVRNLTATGGSEPAGITTLRAWGRDVVYDPPPPCGFARRPMDEPPCS